MPCKILHESCYSKKERVFFHDKFNITYVTSSAATSRAAEIIGGGGSGGGRFGALGTRRTERVWKSDGFIVRKECP